MVSITENPIPPSANVHNFGNLGCKLGQRIRKRKSGRKTFRETRHPIYKGVRQRKGKWVCEMREPHSKSRRIWLGTFTCPVMAARAYDAAAVALKGASAILNFQQEEEICPSSSTATGETDESESSSSHDSLLTCLKASDSALLSPLNMESSAAMEVTAEVKSETLEVYLDEDEIFNMHDLITSLAEGLMLPPPAMHCGLDDDVGSREEFRLWSD